MVFSEGPLPGTGSADSHRHFTVTRFPGSPRTLRPSSLRDALPGGYERGGVLTPATGLGEVLVEPLREAGMIIEINNA